MWRNRKFQVFVLVTLLVVVVYLGLVGGTIGIPFLTYDGITTICTGTAPCEVICTGTEPCEVIRQ